MVSKRQRRVADQIREILSELLRFEADDPRLSGITVMGVDIDRELMYANVFVTSLDGDEARDEVMEALASANGFLRRELGSRMHLQRTAVLRFKWDESLNYGDRIEDLLRSLDKPSDTAAENDDAAK